MSLFRDHYSQCPADPTSDYWADPKPDDITELIYKGAALSDALCSPIIGGTSNWIGVKREAFDNFARIFQCRCADVEMFGRRDRGALI